MDVNLEFSKKKTDRKEFFNFRDKEAQSSFKLITSKTKEFSECFINNKTFINQVEEWRKTLKSYCTKVFKKVIIRKDKSKPINRSISKSIDERNKLKNEDETENQRKMEEINHLICGFGSCRK